MSTQITSLPVSARQVPVTRPTYPVPTTAIFMVLYYCATFIRCEDTKYAQMLLLYNLGLRLYVCIVYIASLFNAKAKLWITGRRNQSVKRLNSSIWFHFASLGEFEQGRPVLENIRETYPGKLIVITFFSPSGYEIRKNTPLADAVYYLPADTAGNARDFIEAINPEI